LLRCKLWKSVIETETRAMITKILGFTHVILSPYLDYLVSQPRYEYISSH